MNVVGVSPDREPYATQKILEFDYLVGRRFFMNAIYKRQLQMMKMPCYSFVCSKHKFLYYPVSYPSFRFFYNYRFSLVVKGYEGFPYVKIKAPFLFSVISQHRCQFLHHKQGGIYMAVFIRQLLIAFF